ncbi:MAG TPA: hypothetical protein VMG98_13595, partial [Verrucomicrobiae bacterium]|nr:hypothetical protein [Verrucomicrobiae bacterium]
GLMTWNKGLQALIYTNAHGTASNTVLEFARNGTTGATLDTSPTTVGTFAGEPLFVSASRDGDYVAVAYVDTSSNIDVQVFYYNGTSWASNATISNSAFANFTSMHFLPSDDLVITVSTAGVAQLYEYTDAGALQSGFTNPANILSDYSSSNDLVNDCAISY